MISNENDGRDMSIEDWMDKRFPWWRDPHLDEARKRQPCLKDIFTCQKANLKPKLQNLSVNEMCDSADEKILTIPVI